MSAGMVELVDTQDLGSCGAIRGGSTPSTRTQHKKGHSGEKNEKRI